MCVLLPIHCGGAYDIIFRFTPCLFTFSVYLSQNIKYRRAPRFFWSGDILQTERLIIRRQSTQLLSTAISRTFCQLPVHKTHRRFQDKILQREKEKKNVAVCMRHLFMYVSRLRGRLSVKGISSGHFSGSLPVLLLMRILWVAGRHICHF